MVAAWSAVLRQLWNNIWAPLDRQRSPREVCQGQSGRMGPCVSHWYSWHFPDSPSASLTVFSPSTFTYPFYLGASKNFPSLIPLDLHSACNSPWLISSSSTAALHADEFLLFCLPVKPSQVHLGQVRHPRPAFIPMACTEHLSLSIPTICLPHLSLLLGFERTSLGLIDLCTPSFWHTVSNQ